MPWLNKQARSALFAAGAGFLSYKLIQRLFEADLRGQVVLITGASRGLGLLMAREFAREGCRLAICARDEQELAAAADDLEQRGAEVLAYRCDISDREQVEWMVDDASRRFGRIDILVNNAGIIQVGPIQSMSLDDFEQAQAVMFWGVLYPTWAVLPQMLERQTGRIVNITSIGGMVSVPHLLPYNCAKFAAVGLSEGLRAELSREGISVTTVVPGTMRTGSHLNALFGGQQEGEFTWFSLGATIPGISINAERAARRIVKATKRGEAMCILGLPAKVLERFHGLFPAATDRFFSLINRVLPSADGAPRDATSKGMDVQQRMHSKLLDTITLLGQKAAEKSHQFAGRGAE